MKKMVLFLLSSLLLSNAKEVNYYPAASYSSDKVRELFKEVEFSDPSVSVHEVKEYHVKGRMVVEFGDVAQLEQSLDDGIALSASKIYFSYVPGKKSLSICGKVQELLAYQVKGVQGLLSRGKLNIGQSTIIFPRKSGHGNITGQYGRFSTDAEVSSRKSVIKFFYDDNRRDTIHRRTEDAQELSVYVNKVLSRKSDQDHRDEFDQTYPELFVHSEVPIKYLMSEVIKSIDDLIVVSPSIEDMKRHKEVIKFSNHIRLLIPDYEFGVYSPQALSLEPKVTIKTPQSLLVVGNFYNNLTFLKLKAGREFFGFFNSNTSNMSMACGGSMYLSSIFTDIEFEYYDRMSVALYGNFVHHLVGMNVIDEAWAKSCFTMKTLGKPLDSLKNLFAFTALLRQDLSDSSDD